MSGCAIRRFGDACLTRPALPLFACKMAEIPLFNSWLQRARQAKETPAGRVVAALDSWVQKARSFQRPTITWPIAAFWIFSLIPFFVENWHEAAGYFSNACRADSEQSVSVYDAARRALLNLDPFSVEPSDIVLVTYSSYEGRYILANVCVQRAFTAGVLKAIAASSPSVIAIDWTNNPASCPDGDASTVLLRNAVTKVINGQIENPRGGQYAPVPVVSARRTWNRQDLMAEPNAEYRAALAVLKPGEQIARPDVLDGTGANFGLIRLECEYDRLPLSWNLYPGLESVGRNSVKADSFSVETVRNSNHARSLESARFRHFSESRVAPYVSLRPETDFEEVHALDLVCNQAPGPGKTFRDCAGDGKAAERAKLRGKIALLADTWSADDFKTTPIGEMPGAVLHANYAEALLTGQYRRPVNVFLQLALSLFWFTGIEYGFRLFAKKPILALIASIAAMCAVAVVANFILIRLFGIQVSLLPPSLVLILCRTCYALGERQEHPGGGVT